MYHKCKGRKMVAGNSLVKEQLKLKEKTRGEVEKYMIDACTLLKDETEFILAHDNIRRLNEDNRSFQVKEINNTGAFLAECKEKDINDVFFKLKENSCILFNLVKPSVEIAVMDEEKGHKRIREIKKKLFYKEKPKEDILISN